MTLTQPRSVGVSRTARAQKGTLSSITKRGGVGRLRTNSASSMYVLTYTALHTFMYYLARAAYIQSIFIDVFRYTVNTIEVLQFQCSSQTASQPASYSNV